MKEMTTDKPQQDAMKTEKTAAVCVLSTHWDREWYETFQHFRYRLVLLLDEVLDVMLKDARFAHFQMDGQTIPIEDYLEVRPERETDVRRLVAEGRLAIGPWYVQPDEFIVSGESLVRNLAEGMRVTSAWGTPSRAGFVCDIFGHNSQLPQILRGFGIESAFIWRGINETRTGKLFRWRSPDGSEVLASRFGPKNGYGDLALHYRTSLDPATIPSPDAAVDLMEKYLAMQEARPPQGMPILLFDGVDHLELEPRFADLIEALRERPGAASYEIRLGTLDSYAAEIKKQAEKITRTIEGELRDPGVPHAAKVESQWLIPGVLSSRIPLKQANARCESLLTQWAEPWSLFAARLGLEYPRQYLRVAWRHLLKNHAHDSICGCSIDQVHKDMEYRFDQAEQIAVRLKRAALEHLAQQTVQTLGGAGCANGNGAEEKPKPAEWLVIANPTSEPIDEPVDVTVKVPLDTPAFQDGFGYELQPGFWLRDAQGRDVPYQRMGQTASQPSFVWTRRMLAQYRPQHHIQVTTRLQIPAYGCTALRIEPVEAGVPTRHGGTSLRTGPRAAENEWLALEIGGGGLLSVTDKRTGQRYEGLLELEDCADIGDGWYHGTAVNDQVFVSGALSAAVACTAEGPQRVSFRVELEWPLPARFDFGPMRRDESRQTLRVIHEITLRAGCDRVEVHTHIENAVQDHRLRVLFPSGAEAEDYWADSPYDVVRRPIRLNPERFAWRELEVETKPQQSWTAVADGQRGLAVISKGLPESAVIDQPGRPIALTLFRAFKKTVFTSGQPGGQIQGPLDFDYWIVPVQGLGEAGEPQCGRLCRLGQRLAAGLGEMLTSTPKAACASQETTALKGFLEVEGDVVVTALKASEDGRTVVRLFNPGTKAAACTIGLPGGVRKAWVCNLNEEPGEPLEVKDGRVVLGDVAGHQIRTVMIED